MNRQDLVVRVDRNIERTLDVIRPHVEDIIDISHKNLKFSDGRDPSFIFSDALFTIANCLNTYEGDQALYDYAREKLEVEIKKIYNYNQSRRPK